MPKTTRRRRKRKRRGTQAGTVGRTRRGRPRNRAEARARARSRSTDRRQREPSWRGAVNRGAIAAAVFLLLLVTLFGRPIAESLYLSAFMLLVYIPLGYYMDRFFYRLRLRREARQAAQPEASKGKG